ncbi:MAG: outer membrane protein assembly factor BamA [Parvularculaceae bacterium]|nr:outer membrane protein assembly factor BamA [Parvularculaceae bacterium]
MRNIKSGIGAAGAFLLSIFAIAAAQEPAPATPQPSTVPQFGLEPGAPAPVIQAIRVSGNQRIEPETIASYLVVNAGDRAEPQLLDIGLKTLFNTGLFADVALEMQPDNSLLITVAENPIVNRVILEGNRRVKADKINEEVKLEARSVFTRAKAQADVQRIIEVYRRGGRFAASVTPKITPLEQNRVDVIYEIDEGPKTGVAKVNFVGNKQFTGAELRGAILTKESRWWRFFSSNNNYDPDRLEYERDLLRQFYAKNGYADFQVISAVAELTPDRKDFFITFTVEEGEQYTIGEVKVKTSLAKLDENALENFVPIKSGETYNGERVEKATESITFATGASGYAFVDVQPRLERNPETRTIDLTFQVNEGPRVYVERINIKGNTRTLDKVIRREIRVAEGDPYNKVLLDRSKSRVRALDYFTEVEIEERPGSAPDRTELDVSVEEKATGSFSVGIGVSSTENFIVDFSIEERNLMGRGQFLRFRVQSSSRTRLVDLRFTQPYFLDRNLAAGASLTNQRTNFRESGFIRDRYGVGVNAGFQISEYWRGNVQYQLARDKVDFDRDNFAFQTGGQVDDGADISNLFIPGATVPTLSPLFLTPEGIATLTPTAQRFLDANGDPQSQYVAFTCDLLVQAFSPTCESQGTFVSSIFGYSVGMDSRDDPIDPTRGVRINFAQSISGLGGDVKYIRTEASGAIYRPLFAGFVGKVQLRGGYTDGFGGDPVRLQDRFYEGADSFRGFEVAGVGPRYLQPGTQISTTDGRFGQSIGAKIYAIGTVEVKLPLPLPKEYGIRASLFTDFGTVGLVDDSSKFLNTIAFNDDNGDGLPDFAVDIDPTAGTLFIEPVQDDLSLRISAGASVSWDSPFGPVRFDFAKVLRKEFYDRTEGFRFSAGTSF